MEQKKMLLVAISVGVFLVIVIGAAMLVFGRQVQAEGVNSIPVSYTEPVNPSQAPEANADTAVDKPAPADTTGLPQDQGLGTPPENVTPPDNVLVTVTIDPKPAAGVPTTAPQGRAVPAAQTPKANTVKPAAKPVPAPAAKPVAVPVAAAPVVKTYNDYWVQAGSFSAKVRADDAKETLASKGITSIIENRDINGATYFRVRIGPYTSQNEADYWLSLIKSIDGFEDSQIWQSRSVR